jgi:hypothetical protein
MDKGCALTDKGLTALCVDPRTQAPRGGTLKELSFCFCTHLSREALCTVAAPRFQDLRSLDLTGMDEREERREKKGEKNTMLCAALCAVRYALCVLCVLFSFLYVALC